MIAVVDMGTLYRRIFERHKGDAEAAQADVLEYLGLMPHREVVLAIDSPPYDRAKAFPAYKAHRKAPPEGYHEALASCIDAVRAACPVMAYEGAEADDVIATVAQWCHANEVACDVYSGDHDLMQLLDVAKVMSHDGQVRQLGWMSPKQVLCYKALRGDPSDGLPGVDGLGKKLAQAVLQRFGTLEAVSTATRLQLEEVPGVGKETAHNIIAAFTERPKDEDPFAIRELARLRRDLPINCEALLPPQPEETPVPEAEESAPQPREVALPNAPAPSRAIIGQSAETSGLYAALVKAQMAAQPALGKKDRNTFANFDYVSADRMVIEGRRAMNAAGLALLPLNQHLRTGPQGTSDKHVLWAIMDSTYRLAHESGQFVDIRCDVPVVTKKGTPEDKATFGATTETLGYLYRGLLGIGRLDTKEVGGVSGRDDREYAPAQRGHRRGAA